jgi:hypothetical protein
MKTRCGPAFFEFSWENTCVSVGEKKYTDKPYYYVTQIVWSMYELLLDYIPRRRVYTCKIPR